ncbi:hypothetical protein DTO164E3_5908 [Paecilomyces variotii]|nr:hypothetical protein DTO032I3_6384 [Paecilomyces variotii]KAJ9197194.1 hypothetical protein DTO164E3_5908 [Paecilomyces variotii]KAJ9274242.1 hypothetical protein DTO021D3_8893 [Paecilomyces variotii]KAJ9341186.1 hypothetical protein DTO027B6_6318 [Paecilomyces variotii]KAJ9350148.1 hypothetical protein DTO027B9_7168 [Paecilomyces variotii]
MPRKALAETDANACITSPAKTTEKKDGLEKVAKETSDQPSLKRKSSSKSDEHEDEHEEKDEDVDGPPSWYNAAAHPFGYQITDNCDQVRRKITAFISSGEMKVGEFQRLLDVSPRSYQLFMRQRGKWKGQGSITYQNAACFFKEREEQGLPPPKKKRATTATTKKTKTGKGEAEEKDKYDVSNIHLDGESEFKVPVFDTCDVVRRKIRHHLRQAGVTQASFLRNILRAAYHPYDPNKKIQSKQLNDFLSKEGSISGNSSSVFYGAYVFFEKLRIRDSKPKDQFRLEMEDEWWPDGFDRECSSRQCFIVPRGTEVFWNKYGRIETTRGFRW